MNRRTLTYILCSIAILIPCEWHSRIQAGDLSSHIYNAWMAQLVDAGRAPGLAIVPQKTNVLFDWLLKGLLDAFGPDVAQRAAVSLAVLIFFWGAWAFICRVSGARPWHLLPIVAMLTYGWVFRMGLFNFYISLGLCLWAMSLAWDFRPKKLAGAAALFAVAYIAHGLPLAWALALLAYRWVAERLNTRLRMLLMGLALAAIVVATAVMRGMWKTHWFQGQWAAVAAIDQIWIYSVKYLLLAVGLLLCWAFLAAGWVRSKGLLPVASSVPFQMCVLTAAGILIIPDWILIPVYNHALMFLSERMSLALGICVCALLGAAPVRRFMPFAIGALAIAFFVLSYRDESALNRLEDRIQSLVWKLPSGQRVVSSLIDLGTATNPSTHMIDRVCLGRCYSYGNYEPSTAQFRIRAVGNSPIVVTTDDDANNLQNGDYIVRDRDLPLYQIVADDHGKLALRPLTAGQRVGTTKSPAL